MSSFHDEEAAMIEREFTEQRGRVHSDSEGYSSYLSSAQDDDDDDNDESSSCEDGSSEDSSSEEDVSSQPPLFSRASSLMRRRAPLQGIQDDAHENVDDDSKTRPRRSSLYRERGICRPVNAVLCLSVFAWLCSRLLSHPPHGAHPQDQQRHSNSESLLEKLFTSRQQGKLTPGEIAQLRKERTKEAREALGSAARGSQDAGSGGFFNFFGYGKKKKKNSLEDLKPGCEFRDWQKLSFPNCNELHEIDLRDALHLHKYSSNVVAVGEKRDKRAALEAKRVGYVGSGLWRTVWKVDPRDELDNDMTGEFQAPAVLKMMKGEHEVDERNMDRHRRDALVMERLTSSPYIVSMYAYCGNSVLTEYVATDLDSVIYNENDSTTTRQTPEGRLRLALGIAKGVQAMHETEGGPIIHADIVPQQFLVANDGTVKLNDFNRCRFIPHKNSTGEACDVKIPSAPGIARSPEEYGLKALTEKADMYSVANVLYEILTGVEPWLDIKASSSKFKEHIKQGKKPPIADQYLIPNTSDAGLAALVDSAYEHDPVSRISASELVTELESLLREFGS
jgi:hypothetical protein